MPNPTTDQHIPGTHNNSKSVYRLSAQDDFVATPLNRPVTINAIPDDADHQDQPLDVFLLNSPTGGTAFVDDVGMITFQPHNGFIGTSTIHYLLESSDGKTSEATITVEVTTPLATTTFANRGATALNPSQASNPFEDGQLSQPSQLSHKIFTAAPDPLISGFANPSSQIMGRIYDQSGVQVGTATDDTDADGNWSMQTRNIEAHQFYRVEFSYVSATTSADYLKLNPADTGYESLAAFSAGN